MPTDSGLIIMVDGDGLDDLHRSLRAETPWLRVGKVRLPPRPGEMGGGLVTALETALLSKEVLGAVITGIAGWLAARAATRRTKIRVKRGDVEFEIDTVDVAEAGEIAVRMSRELGGSG